MTTSDLFQARYMARADSAKRASLTARNPYQEHLPVFGSGFCRGSQHFGFFPAASCTNTIRH
eukprot:COSAG04_NODE_1885_length_5306_cov_14.242174_2_plen_62_part_00